MSLDYIRSYYGVPAKRGGRVEYYGGKQTVSGTICGSQGAYLLVRLDGKKFPTPFHPEWRLRFLDAPDADLKAGER